VIIASPALPNDHLLRRRTIKSRLTHSLIAHLSGRVSLDRFRTLMHRLEQWFPFYYPLMPAPAAPPEARQTCSETLPPAVAQSHRLVRGDLLQEWLEKAADGILPRRPQRKLLPERLQDFLLGAGGRWFRGKELARHFDIDRKTAWEYLQKLQDTGLLIHNGGRSAAVRYRLADRFLKVQLTALEHQVARALQELPRPLAPQAAQWLAATVGEPFWEEDWPARLGPTPLPQILSLLELAGLLEVVCLAAGRRMLRLSRRWLQ
jgi:biotin operon repressor